VVHGDLKPENIMVVGKTGDIKLCDFGLSRRTPARVADNDTTATTSLLPNDLVAGTPAYMAPETLAGNIGTPRSDVFALGVVFYELLAGRHPFRDPVAGRTVQRIAGETPAPLDEAVVPTYISDIVFKMLQKDPQARYRDAGELLVDLESASVKARTTPRWKKLAARAGVLLIALLAGTVLFVWNDVRPRVPSGSPNAVPAAIRTLAIVPFDAVGSTPSQQAQVDGLSETLNAVLVKLSAGHNLQVLPAKDIRARQVKSIDDARQELGATLVLRGTVQYSGKLVRVNSLLTDGVSGKQVRAETVTVDSGDPFLLQDRIVDVAVRMLDIRLQPVDLAALQQHGTKEPGAYEFYLQGRGYLLNFDRAESLDSAIQLFNNALKMDSKYSLAFAGLGEAYWHHYEATKDQKLIEPARMACERAVSLGSSLATPHLCLGTIYAGTGSYEKAINEFNRALEIEPTMEGAYLNLGIAYQRLKQPDKAEETYRRAIDLKPQYWGAYSALGIFYYSNAQYELALQMFQQAVNLAPDSYRTYSNLGAVYHALGRTSEATRAFEKSMSIRPNYAAASNLGTLFLFDGAYPKAVEAFRQALGINQNDFVVWGNLGSALHWSGQDKESAAAYEQARTRAEARLKVDSRNLTVLIRLAEYNGALGSKNESLSYLRRALSTAPEDPEVLFKAAVVYEYNLKRRDDALQMLERAIQRRYSWKEIDRSPSLSELRKDPRYAKLRNAP
jgi:tetratricopeptide (TPR) repeat protein/TolB-like protein